MTLTGFPLDRGIAVAALGAALVGFAAAHSIEDFLYDVPSERFGIDASPAAALLGVGLAAQALLIAGAARDAWLGFVGNVAVGLSWLVAALLDHGGEVLFESPYRGGMYSKAIEVGTMAAGAALVVASVAALRSKRRADSSSSSY